MCSWGGGGERGSSSPRGASGELCPVVSPSFPVESGLHALPARGTKQCRDRWMAWMESVTGRGRPHRCGVSRWNDVGHVQRQRRPGSQAPSCNQLHLGVASSSSSSRRCEEESSSVLVSPLAPAEARRQGAMLPSSEWVVKTVLDRRIGASVLLYSVAPASEWGAG